MSAIFKGTPNYYIDLPLILRGDKPKCKSDYGKYEIQFKYFIYHLLNNLYV